MLFGSGAHVDYPPPDRIYALNPVHARKGSATLRPLQTVQPLADRLGLSPITTFALGEEDRLAAEIMAHTGVVLVAWEHKAIAERLLPALLGKLQARTLLPKWDALRFDVVLRLDRKTDGVRSACQLLPHVLGGDEDQSMA